MFTSYSSTVTIARVKGWVRSSLTSHTLCRNRKSLVTLQLTSCYAISTVVPRPIRMSLGMRLDIHCDIIATPWQQKLCNLQKHRSRWSHHISATVTNQWLQCDQILPHSAKSVACQTRYKVLVLSQQRCFWSKLPYSLPLCVLSLVRSLSLLQDPHYHGPVDEDHVLQEGYVKWHSLKLFDTASFYNFCLPQSPSW